MRQRMRRISFKIHPRNQQGCFASVRRLFRRNSSWKSAYVATGQRLRPNWMKQHRRDQGKGSGALPPKYRTELLQRRVGSRRSDLLQVTEDRAKGSVGGAQIGSRPNRFQATLACSPCLGSKREELQIHKCRKKSSFYNARASCHFNDGISRFPACFR